MNPHRSQPDRPAADPTHAEREQMRVHDISCDGTHYYFSGYRYTQLGDALNYARLTRERPELPSRGHAVAASGTAAPLTDDARVRMSRLGVALEAGTFRFAGFRYDRLEDALAYAELASRREGVGRDRTH